jgi:lipopolysaccharide export LptBFGC system permease protein LptF
MTVTIGLGWWLAPFTVTIAAFALAWWFSRPSNGYGQIVGAMVAVIFFSWAVIVALLAWLIWAILA